MSYYFIVDTYIRENDSGEYNNYIAEVKPIVERFGGKYLVCTNTVISLNDGRCPQRSIVIEFPDKAAVGSSLEGSSNTAISSFRQSEFDATPHQTPPRPKP